LVWLLAATLAGGSGGFAAGLADVVTLASAVRHPVTVPSSVWTFELSLAWLASP
jgi:hypothetical protein